MRIEAGSAAAYDVARVTLDDIDVTALCRWADSERGEIGMYGHTADGHLIDVSDAEPDITAPKLERIPHPVVDRIEAGLYVVRGAVDITFKAAKPDLAITE